VLPVLTVLVRLTSAELDFDTLRADGHDVRFVDQRGATPAVLAHERQHFVNGGNDADDLALFWVKVPQVNPSTERDHIWMYFGSADPTDTSTGAEAFADYNAAWHFDDPGSGIALPEARTGRSTKVQGNNLDTDPSFVHRGLALSGNNTFAVLDDQLLGEAVRTAPFALAPGSGSFSFLVGPFNDNGTNRPFGNGHTVFYADGPGPTGSSGFDNRSVHLTIVDTTGDPRAGLRVSLPTNPPRNNLEGVAVVGGALDRNVFSHVLMSWTPNGVQVYVNGALVAIGTATIVPFAVDVIEIGSSQQTGNVLRAGFDELRVANAPRSAAFARAEALSIRDLLVTPGPVELQ
jgi:hypothetical protein